MKVKELKEFLEMLDEDSDVSIVDDSQSVCYDILELRSCDDTMDFLDIAVEDEAFDVHNPNPKYVWTVKDEEIFEIFGNQDLCDFAEDRILCQLDSEEFLEELKGNTDYFKEMTGNCLDEQFRKALIFKLENLSDNEEPLRELLSIEEAIAIIGYADFEVEKVEVK